MLGAGLSLLADSPGYTAWNQGHTHIHDEGAIPSASCQDLAGLFPLSPYPEPPVLVALYGNPVSVSGDTSARNWGVELFPLRLDN